jgi:ATP-dependent DNA helicase RecG
VLLFADEPQAVLPKRSGVKLYGYKTSSDAATRETLDGVPRSIEGPIYDLIKSAVEQTVALIEGIQKLGPKGWEPVKYPFVTLDVVIEFADERQALAFEQYLKSGSRVAFAQRHLR